MLDLELLTILQITPIQFYRLMMAPRGLEIGQTLLFACWVDDIIHHDGLSTGSVVREKGKAQASSNLIYLLKCINFKVAVIIPDLAAPKMLPISGQGLVEGRIGDKTEGCAKIYIIIKGINA